MNSLTFIGVSFYLFPEEAEALDAHAAKVVVRLTQSGAQLQPVLEAFDTGSGFGEGLRDLWRGTNSALFVYMYGDTALLTALCPPRELAAADGSLPSLIVEDSSRWGRLFTRAETLAPYQSACVHVFEFEGGAGQASEPHAGDRWARVADEGGGGFLWKLAGENEHLLVAAKDDPWFHEWCFESAHLFRLLLFHGKAHRYFQELLQVDVFGSKRKGGRFSRRQLQAIARKESNLEIAAQNFAAEWRNAVPGPPTSLSDFFVKAHKSWCAQALKISREAEASAALADEQSAEARRKPMGKANKHGGARRGAQRNLEVEIKLKDDGQAPPFDREAFREFWESRYRGKSGEIKESARGLSFTWRGVRPEAVIADSEKGAIDRAVADSGGDALYEVKDGGVQVYQYVPEVKLKTPAMRSVPPDELTKRKSEVELAVMVVTPIELDAAMHFLRPWPGERAVLMGHLGTMTYRFGRFGNYRAALFESAMGSSGSQAATLSTQQALTDFSPKALLAVGIAFGVNRAKQNMGDVLVAESIRYYGHVKTGPTEVTQRGYEYTCGEILSERFRTLHKSWRLDAGGRRVQVHQGVVLSADNLLNNLAERDRLVKLYPQAVGGEMEGSGAYATAKRGKTEIILVKAICDWADGHKNDRAQPFAAYAAASLASHVLSQPGALAALGAEDVERAGTNVRNLME